LDLSQIGWTKELDGDLKIVLSSNPAMSKNSKPQPWPQNAAVRFTSPIGLAEVGEIDHHRVKAPLEPAIERVEITPVWPHSRHTVPPIQLLLEYLTAHLAQILARFFLVLTLW
jgi:hypothetical protein